MNPHCTSTGTGSEPPRSDSLCSCSKMTCDSLFCFAKRHDYASCSCNNCGKSKSCPFYGTQVTGINEVCDGSASNNPAGQKQRSTVIGFTETCHGPAKAPPFQSECCNLPEKNTPCEKNERDILNLLKAILGLKSSPTPCCTVKNSSQNPVNLEKYIEQISKSHHVGIKPSFKLQRYIDEITQKANTDICTELKKQRDAETTKKLEDYIKQITQNKKSKPITGGYHMCSEIKNNLDKKYSDKLDKYIKDITQPKTAKPKHVNEFGEVCCLIKKFLDQMHTENLSKTTSKKESSKECQLCKHSTEKKHREDNKESSQSCCHTNKRSNQIEELCNLIRKNVEKKDCKCSKTDTSEICLSDKRKDQKRLESSCCKVFKKIPTCTIGINTESECKRMHDDCNETCKLERKRSCTYKTSSRHLQRSCPYNNSCRNLPINKSDELEVKQNQVDYLHHETNEGLSPYTTQVTDITFHATVSRPMCSSSKSSLKINREKSDCNKNLITRLKEAYKACSCKICECVSGKIIKPEPCNCKPCDCVQCVRYMNPNQLSVCNCNPCNCFKCANIMMCKRQDCSCTPCECIECKRRPNYTYCDRREKRCQSNQRLAIDDGTLKICQSGQKQGTKDCSMCDRMVYRCQSSQSIDECSSMGIRRPKRCESRHKQAINHPSTCGRCQSEKQSCSVTGLMQELGIDTLLRDLCLFNESSSKSCCSITVKATDPKQIILSKCKNKRNNHDTLAMFASVSNTFSIFTSKNTVFNRKSCECEECECITSICKEKISSMKTSDEVISKHVDETCIYRTHGKLKLNNDKSKIHMSPKFCGSKKKCSLCKRDISSKCAIASKETEYDGFNSGRKTSSIINTKFVTIPVSEYHEIYKYKENKQNKPNPIEGLCRCTECKCERCFGDECFTQSNVNKSFSIRKGEMLTPSSHQIKIQNLMLKRQCDGPFRSYSPTITKTSQRYINKQPKDTNINFTKTKRPTPQWLNNLLHIIKTTGLTGPDDVIEVEDNSSTPGVDTKAIKNTTYEISPSKDAEISYLDSKCKGHNTDNNNIYYKSSESSISDYVSLESISSQDKLNNSGHKNVIRPSYNCNNNSNNCPKSTLEVCLKDVMELNLDRDIKLDEFRIIYKPNTHNNEKNLKYVSDKRSYAQNSVPIRRHLIKDLCRQSNKTLNSKWDHSSSKYNNIRKAYYSSKRDSKYYARSKNITDSTELIKMRQSRNDLKNSSSNSREQTRKRMQLEQLQRFNLEQAINNDTSLPIKESATVNKVISTNQFKPTFDDDYYIRVQRTLQEANDYSKKLMSILEKYERANKEFESISMKLKHSQELFINDKYTEQQLNSETHNFKNKYVVKQINTTEYTSLTKEIKKSTVTCERKENAISNIDFNRDKQEGERFLDMNYCFMDGSIESNCILNHDVFNNSCLFEHAEFHLTTEQADSKQEFTETIGKKVKKETKRTLKMPKKHEMKLKESIYKKTNKKRGKFLRHTILGLKRIKAKRGWHKLIVTSSERLVKSISTSMLYFKTKDDETIDYYERTEENDTAEEYKCVIPKYVLKNVTTNTDYAELFLNGSIEKIDSKNTFVLKLKESCQTKPFTKGQGVSVSNSINLDSVQSISLQTDKQFCTYHYKNEALTRLQSEVHELLKMLLLHTQSCTEHTHGYEKYLDDVDSAASQSVATLSRSSTSGDKDWSSDHSYTEKDINIETRIHALMSMGLLQPILDRIHDNNDMIGHSNIASGTSCGACYDAYKVGSVGVRSVSQHTALVEWELPRAVNEVEGYEILVDGCSVENLVSPDKNMALITSLPEVDQLLLTVRTVLRATDVRYPSVTVVYRP